jgi:23S rRNA pseudouridine1911/1915/1917 synthase
MEETRSFTVERGRPPERLDRFLAEQLPELTRSQLKRLVEEGLVTLDQATAKAGARLKGGETVSVNFPPAAPVETLPQSIPLHIFYEDAHLIVIDKPAGLVVHPAPGHAQGTLVNALLHHCTDLAGIGGELRPGIVHRLDKDTSGVMVAVKNDAAHNSLARQFQEHTVKRRYVALLHGLVQADTGVIDRPIGRHPVDRKRMSVHARRGRQAVTRWRVLRRFDKDRLTLAELVLETGRTHQIRVHLGEMNFPVVGDPVYGGSKRLAGITDPQLRRLVQQLGRQALHARLIGFLHPQTGEYLEFESPLPADMQGLLDYLDGKYAAPADSSGH